MKKKYDQKYEDRWQKELDLLNLNYKKTWGDVLRSLIVPICIAVPLLVLIVVAYLNPTPIKYEQSYISTYQVHYLDGSIDTAFVTGERSQEAGVDPPGFFGGGYTFCGEEGIYRVRLLSVKKDLKPTTTSRNNIKLKNNK